jgi:ABC-type transport system involved in multi-copper enzyme maturation permease subunit
MSVYKHTYRAYTGRTTPLWTRVLVLARYGLIEVWSSRISIGLFTLSALPAVVFLILIYLANNPLARALIMRGNTSILNIDSAFFFKVQSTQSWLALVVTSWIAPRLITFDLADNALPILLSHPISRFSYLLGKFLALFASLSCITWIPCLTLFLYQSYSSSTPWAIAHLSLAAGLLAGSFIWITLLSLLSLALSSWVKWRTVATGVIFAAVFVPAGVGGIISAILRTKWGLLLNLPVVMSELWQRLLGAPEFMHARQSLPSDAIACTLALTCLVSIVMLNARIRAREVVRG